MGTLYVIFDGMSGLSKIGCTRGTKKARQRSIMAAHGSVLANVINVQVDNHNQAEAQCHRHFKDYRTNGEWFSADLTEIINYIHNNIEWQSIEYLELSRMIQYILACKSGNTTRAREMAHVF